MSELGDVLELLYDARGRYTTARLEARKRRRYRLQNEAYERARRQYSHPQLVRTARNVSSMAESSQLNSTEEREQGGTTLRVSSDGFPRVLVEREGICVELSSQRYTPEELAELALTLVPAAKERPPLVE